MKPWAVSDPAATLAPGEAPAAGLARAIPALAWVIYMPLGLMYLAWLPIVLVCLVTLCARRGAAFFLRQPTALPALLLLLWLALSALWSPAPPTVMASHFGLYSLVLSLPLVSAVMPASWASRALRHFCAASGLIGLLMVLVHAKVLPTSLLWHTPVDAEGNQRIATSIMLALGAAFSLWHGTQAFALRPRLAWLALAVLITLALSLQDRRTGFVVLPIMLLAWALATPGSWRRRLGVACGIVMCMLIAWQASDNIRARFAEGLAEVRAYESKDAVSTSWGQRLRMAEITAEMVREKPILGHGLGSWRQLWQQRTPPGTQLHGQTTPHNEYLLLAQQAGAPAVLLLLWLVFAGGRAALRAGAAGIPSLMLWTTFACAAPFNVVLRDAKFALPLFMLAAWSLAALRAEEQAPDAIRA